MLTPIVPAGQWIPPGLSQAMLIKGGNLLVLSGHVPVNSEGAIVDSDVESRSLQTFESTAATPKVDGRSGPGLVGQEESLLDRAAPRKVASLTETADGWGESVRIQLDAPIVRV